MEGLRITDTNSVNDSKGRAFGLQGNDFIYVIVALVVSLGLYLAFAFVLRVGMGIALLFSAPVLFAAIAWVVCLRHNKPEGYAEDLFDDLVNGEGWTLVRQPPLSSSGKDARAQ